MPSPIDSPIDPLNEDDLDIDEIDADEKEGEQTNSNQSRTSKFDKAPKLGHQEEISKYFVLGYCYRGRSRGQYDWGQFLLLPGK